MENIYKLLEIMKKRSGTFSEKYFIPERWNSIDYTDYETSPDRPGEISVDPYSFFTAFFKHEINIKNCGRLHEYPQVGSYVIYSMFIRSFTAWPHSGKGELSKGTFVKAIMLLPLLKKLGINAVYLLPVFRCGESYKKGELGSPYAIRDIYRIDQNLHDPLLGECTEELLEMEFRAFVEACHALGMKVILDFVMRTVSRDSVLISQHPDWFYWIKSEYRESFSPPKLGDGKKFMQVTPKTVRMLYQSPGIYEYLAQFADSPDHIDQYKWELLCSGNQNGMLDNIEREFGVTTVPGFSDVINDSQPPWTDVTYLKFYFDNPAHTFKIPENQPPYIMQDGASLNNEHGIRKNMELWGYMIGVLPYYKINYGIDGARIDMAHALPNELCSIMKEAIKQADPHFILWSEELDTSKSKYAEKDGFDFISGGTYYAYKKIKSSEFNRALLQQSLLSSVLPVAASAETPDTPRAALLNNDESLLKLMLTLNAFVPNAVQLINSGQVLREKQPMNLGLDNDENGRFVLQKSDPMYGKLAFFDNCSLHWLNNSWLFDTLRDILKIRRQYLSLISNKNSFIEQPEFYGAKKLTVLCYYNETSKKGLFIAANRSDSEGARLIYEKHLPGRLAGVKADVIYSTAGKPYKQGKGVTLKPCEAIIAELKSAEGE